MNHRTEHGVTGALSRHQVRSEDWQPNVKSSRVKHVYLEFSGRKHSIYDTLLQYPPDGYEFFTSRGAWDTVLSGVYSSDFVYNSTYKVLNRLIPMHVAKGILERRISPCSADLTFASGHVVFREEPWVVDFEFSSQLAGYNYHHLRLYRGIIEKRLASRSNKAILPWTDASRETLVKTFDCNAMKDKIAVLRHAVPAQQMHRDSKNGIRLLFVGSSNYNYEKDFLAKGGREVFALYDMLSKRYDGVYLTVRSRVPSEFHGKYDQDSHVRIIDSVLSWSEVSTLFQESDMFLFPTHGTPARVFLDAMSFGLPIVTTDVWANREYVTDNVTGLIIPRSKKIPYLSHDLFPNTFSRDFMHALSRLDESFLSDLFDATSKLVEDSGLRTSMSRSSHREVESGRFSLSKRNAKLLEVFEGGMRR